MPTNVLYLGASGYIGGSVLVGLIKENPNIVFKALVRSKSDVDPVAATGAIAVKDSLTNYDALSEQVSNADVVFNSATADDVPLNEAILRGFKKKYDEGRGVGTLIHTSGTANFTDGRTDGKYDPNARVWTDSEENIRKITFDFFHGKVDIPILKAGEEGYVNTHIIAPPGVFGYGDGPVRKFNPWLVSAYVSRGYAWYIGEGTAVVSVIHIKDLVDFYKAVFSDALKAKDLPLQTSPYTRFYLPMAHLLPWKTLVDSHAKALYERGKVSKPEGQSHPLEGGGDLAVVWAANMIVKSEQADRLGWKPKLEVTEDVLTEGIDAGLTAIKI